MSICTPNNGPWSATSRVGATLLAPASDVVLATGLSTAASFDATGVFAGWVNEQAMATPQTHKYINRPGSPPRGTR